MLSYNLAARDIIDGISRWELWIRLGRIEIRRRYRRTVIGPFWTTLSMAIFILAVGVVFANLWKMSLESYLPYLTSGLIAWIFVSTIITESCNVFTSAEGILKQFSFPLTTFACLNVWRNLVVFFHNFVIYIVVALIFTVNIGPQTLLFIVGLAFIVVNGVWLTILIGMLSCRFRDVQPLVSSFLQILMLVTPIFWPPEQVGNLRYFLVDPNVIYHFVMLIRAPLLGEIPSLLSWVVVMTSTVIGWGFTFYILAKYRSRVIYWI